MLPSYHLRMRFLLQEDEPDFARAWALEPTRARGERVPRHCLDPRLLLYSKVAQLGAQVEQLFAIAGRERSHVIVFDDLVADPLRVYRGALDFLGVDYDGQTRFESRYESRMYRYRWLQRMLFVPAVQRRQDDGDPAAALPEVQPGWLETPGLIKRVTRVEQGPRVAGAAAAGDGRRRARNAAAGRGAPVAAPRPRFDAAGSPAESPAGLVGRTCRRRGRGRFRPVLLKLTVPLPEMPHVGPR